MATYGPGGSRRASKQTRRQLRESGSRTSSVLDPGRPRDPAPERDVTRRTPRPATRRRYDVAAASADAIDGRENEFVGIGLVAVGVLLGAGHLPRPRRTARPWRRDARRLVHRARPLRRADRADRRRRRRWSARAAASTGSASSLGCGVAALSDPRAAARRARPREDHGPTSTRSARPVAGSARSSANRCARCSPTPGAIVVFVALFLARRAAHHRLRRCKTLMAQAGRGVGAVARAARQGRAQGALRDRRHRRRCKSEREHRRAWSCPAPSLYDVEADDDVGRRTGRSRRRSAGKPTGRRRPRRRCRTTTPASRPSSSSVRARKRGAWVLPPVELPPCAARRRRSTRPRSRRAAARWSSRSSRTASRPSCSVRRSARPSPATSSSSARASRSRASRASTATSPTRWPPPTCASWRRSPAARRSASRCRTTPASSSRSATS